VTFDLCNEGQSSAFPRFTFRKQEELIEANGRVSIIVREYEYTFSGWMPTCLVPTYLQGQIDTFLVKIGKKCILYSILFNNCTVSVQKTAEHSGHWAYVLIVCLSHYPRP
jgi:hypothetical protein